MTYQILRNTREVADLLVTAANTIVVSGNDSVSAIALDGQVLTGAAISKVIASTVSGNGAYWSISRNTTPVVVVDTATLDFAAAGMSVTANSDQTLAITLTNGPGSLYIRLKKEFNVPDDFGY